MRLLKKNIWSVIPLALAGVLLIVILNQCEIKRSLERDLESSLTFLEVEKQQSIDRDTIHAQEIRNMNQNIMSEIAARKLLEDEFNRFKEISSHTRFESTTRIDTMWIPYSIDNNNVLADYSDYIPVDTVNKYFIQIPKGLNFNDGWFDFSGRIDTSGMMIDSMSFINKFDVTIGYKKSEKPFAFLRKKEPVVELVSYNPYTSINYVNNVIIEEDNSNIFTSKPAWFVYGGVLVYGILKLKQ